MISMIPMIPIHTSVAMLLPLNRTCFQKLCTRSMILPPIFIDYFSFHTIFVIIILEGKKLKFVIFELCRKSEI